MSEVLAAITHRLSEEYSRIELKSDDAKKRCVPCFEAAVDIPGSKLMIIA